MRCLHVGVRLIVVAILTAGAAAPAPPPSAPDVATVVTGNTDFALDLYARLAREDGNLFLSPFGVSSALAMTWAGARGVTEQEMGEVLRFGADQGRLHAAFGALIAEVEGASGVGGCRLSVANALWGQRGMGFREEFLALVRRDHGAGLREVDFAGATEAARREINAWVADRTQQQIRELLRSADLDPTSVLVLTNAIDFAGSWASRFDPAASRESLFETSAGGRVTATFMRQTRVLPLASGDGVDVLELPYEGDRLSMVVLLPTRRQGLPALERELNAEGLRRLIGRLAPRAVSVSLPRFEMTSRFDLARALAAMGMATAFTPAADFSGMTGGPGLSISRVIHQARVAVGEHGTEASAATAVVLKRGPAPASFVADHPFLFLVRDRQTGSILFIGRVTDPTA